MKSMCDYKSEPNARIERYRERARQLRSVARWASPARRGKFLEIAQELEELADIIERLRFGDD